MSADNPHPDARLEPLACVACRARKLKCDRAKGACNRCVKIETRCVYPESRRKPTFKRRNVKELEARLEQVESYLKEVNKGSEDVNGDPDDGDIQLEDFNFNATLPGQASESQADSVPGQYIPFDMPDLDPSDQFTMGSGELMGLGLSEALPPFEVMEELNNAFFQGAHHLIPVVHPGRYYQAFYGGAVRKPPMVLQYAIWAMGSLGYEKYSQYSDIFYRRARQYGEADEMKGFGEHFITIQHGQAWAIIASYEAKNMLFTRASMSTSRAVRLANMMGLDRLDFPGQEIPPALAPPTSWTEVEERRRVFWGIFAIDAHASIATGWPSLVNSSEIMTRLPSSEEAFLSGEEATAPYLDEVFNGEQFSAFASTVVICQMFKSIMAHTHRAKPSDNPHELMHGPFWTRHRDLDNKLSGLFMFLPEIFRLPQQSREPAAIHTNLNLHASVICLHHAAIEMCDKHDHDESVKNGSIARLKTSAEEIVNIVKMTSHQATIFKSPLCALSLYCATTVYVYLAKNEKTASQVTAIDIANLKFIIQAMEAIGRRHEMTRSFVRQVYMDIERNNLSAKIHIPNLAKYRDTQSGVCSNIPLLTRGQVARHTAISPVLPGRLPLERPQGRLAAEDGLSDKHFTPTPPNFVRDLTNTDCFQPMLGAVSRNVAVASSDDGKQARQENRRRMPNNANQTLADGIQYGAIGASSDHNMSRMPNMKDTYDKMAPSLAGAGLWRAGGLSIRGSPRGDGKVLMDQMSSSSSSSPQFRGTGTGTETQSGSSHTSPGTGLGNTTEENRVDLRSMQNRISTPIWQPTDDMFLANNMNEPMGHPVMGAGDNGDPWSFMTEELNWDAINGPMNGQSNS